MLATFSISPLEGLWELFADPEVLGTFSISPLEGLWELFADSNMLSTFSLSPLQYLPEPFADREVLDTFSISIPPLKGLSHSILLSPCRIFSLSRAIVSACSSRV